MVKLKLGESFIFMLFFSIFNQKNFFCIYDLQVLNVINIYYFLRKLDLFLAGDKLKLQIMFGSEILFLIQ